MPKNNTPKRSNSISGMKYSGRGGENDSAAQRRKSGNDTGEITGLIKREAVIKELSADVQSIAGARGPRRLFQILSQDGRALLTVEQSSEIE